MQESMDMTNVTLGFLVAAQVRRLLNTSRRVVYNLKKCKVRKMQN
jgi:hypothetical protein